MRREVGMADGGTEIRCGECGTENPLTNIHCRKCGAKLDYEHAERTLMRGVRRGIRWQRRVSALLFWAMCAVLGLLLWPARLERETGDAMDAKRYRLKVELLQDQLNRGQPGSQEILEGEINSWLARQLSRKSVEEGGIKEAAVKFGEGGVTGFLLTERGFLRLSATYTAKARGGRLELTGLRVGHLPLPAWGWLAERVAVGPAALAEAFPAEARILGSAEALAAGEGKVDVLTGGK